MCGIFAFLNNNSYNPLFDIEHIKQQFMLSQSRGPESSIWNELTPYTYFGFHRLAINGLNTKSNQPFFIDDCVLICNGEIYNYKELYKCLPDNIPKSDSDCEIIIHLYKKYGIEYTLNNLDGEFAFILYDLNNQKIFVARDPYGVRPLFQLTLKYSQIEYFGFSSELKQLCKLDTSISQFKPSTYSTLVFENNQWNMDQNQIYYTNTGFYTMVLQDISENNLHYIYDLVRINFINAVKKRVVGTTDRPVACLLSGGLDSSLVTSIVSKFVPNLETYSIGLKGSEDLKYAKIVANFLGTKHHEVIVTEDDFFNSIPKVIDSIESYDTTTVRASVGNYLISKYISENSTAKVIFNGDGSDELTGGYLYMNACPNDIEFDFECRRLLENIHFFDGLRSDRTISCNGLEARTPFLDRGWVQFYLSIPKNYRNHITCNKPEKYILREAFNTEIIKNGIKSEEWLPQSVLFRTKEAFSDGVSSLQKSWYEIIQEKVQKKFKDSEILFLNYNNKVNPPETLEQLYYRNIFDNLYSKCEKVIPYFWMPNYVDAKDASARTLSVYQKNNSNIKKKEQVYL